ALNVRGDMHRRHFSGYSRRPGNALSLAPVNGEKPPRQWKRKRAGDALHSGDCAQPVPDLADEGSARLGRGSAVVAVKDEGEQVARVESGIDALQFQEAAEHQPRAYQQDE